MEFLFNPLIKKEEWNRFTLENGSPLSREASASANASADKPDGHSEALADESA